MNATSKGVTRRKLGLTFMAMPAAALAQQPPAEDVLAVARDQVKSTSEELRKYKVPIATEPSFAFRP